MAHVAEPPVVSTVSFGTTQIIFTERMDRAMTLVDEHFTDMVLVNLENDDWTAYAINNGHWTGESYPVSTQIGPYCFASTVSGQCSVYVRVNYIVSSLGLIQYFTKTTICTITRYRYRGNLPIGDYIYSNNEYQHSVECTPTESFLKSTDPPSETGVRWMLNAIQGHNCPLHTPVHNLPRELQEMILDYAYPSLAKHNFSRAVFSSQLDIGLPFDFQSNNPPIVLCELQKLRAPGWNQPEYHIWFWGVYAGLTYQVDDGSTRTKPVFGKNWEEEQMQLARVMFDQDDRSDEELERVLEANSFDC